MSRQILVVEDEPSIAENIQYALQTEGFEPICCKTAAEALESLRTRKIELIILDIGLPDKTGFDLAREIHALKHTPIIFVTARSDEVDRVLGLELGADDYVVKPFSPRELTARVKAVLRRSRSDDKSSSALKTFSFGPFQVDESKHLIIYHNTALELSRYEFDLLCLLIRNPGRVYTREHMMSLVWEEPDMTLQRTVDAHIKNIRHKLKTIAPAKDPIVTHRGVGYALSEKL